MRRCRFRARSDMESSGGGLRRSGRRLLHSKHRTSLHERLRWESGENELFYVFWAFTAIVCITCCARCVPRGRRIMNQGAVARWRDRRMRAEETALEADIAVMQGRLKHKRLIRQVATARAQQEDMVNELTRAQDERGRSLYGTEAWDEGVDGNVPMKEIFSLGENELREIKIEAYNRVAAEEKRMNGSSNTFNAARITAMTEIHRNKLADLSKDGNIGRFGNFNNEKLTEKELDEEVMSPLLVTARTNPSTSRSHHSRAGDAPFDDPRFVVPRRDRPSGLPWMFSSAPSRGVLARVEGAPLQHGAWAPKNVDVTARDIRRASGEAFERPGREGEGGGRRHDRDSTATDRARAEKLRFVQAKGLMYPSPPPLPPPALRSAKDEGRSHVFASITGVEGNKESYSKERRPAKRKGMLSSSAVVAP